MILRLVALTVGMLGLCNAAYAACWKLADGSIIETNSNSTPPVKGAKRVMCSKIDSKPVKSKDQIKKPRNPDSPAPAVGVTVSDKRADQSECVEYARSRVSKLPYGLFSFQNKLDIVNSKTARAGVIAIIKVPTGSYAEYGHVAYVESVSANSIQISETNFGGRQFQKRTSVGNDLADAEKRLNIVGYFDPSL